MFGMVLSNLFAFELQLGKLWGVASTNAHRSESTILRLFTCTSQRRLTGLLLLRKEETANFKLVEKLMTSTGFGIFLHSSTIQTNDSDII